MAQPPVDLKGWRDERRHVQDDPGATRSAGERDRDRILYSPAFRRLQAVTQVMLAADQGYLQHNRLTHSLKVAQVGRRIAENLSRAAANDARLAAAVAKRGGLDPDVVEAAGLAHDLGHPPFGHIAEERLQRLIEDDGRPDSFEGNAQSFRIVTRLAAIDTRFAGLDLTRATLNAILKYPWRRGPGDKKWGCYESEGDDFDWARGTFLRGRSRSLEAEIMDWADDITYAIHDVEDFFRVGLIPLGALRDRRNPDVAKLIERTREKLRTDADPRYRMEVSQRSVRLAWEETLATFTLSSYDETTESRAKLSRYSSGLIGDYVVNTGLTESGRLRLPRRIRIQVALLKQLTKMYVVEAPQLATQQQGQRRVVDNLYNEYMGVIQRAVTPPAAITPAEASLMFPTSAAAAVKELAAAAADRRACSRTVADVVAGLTEAQALTIHHRLIGFDFGRLVDPAVS